MTDIDYVTVTTWRGLGSWFVQLRERDSECPGPEGWKAGPIQQIPDELGDGGGILLKLSEFLYNEA